MRLVVVLFGRRIAELCTLPTDSALFLSIGGLRIGTRTGIRQEFHDNRGYKPSWPRVGHGSLNRRHRPSTAGIRTAGTTAGGQTGVLSATQTVIDGRGAVSRGIGRSAEDATACSIGYNEPKRGARLHGVWNPAWSNTPFIARW